MLTLLLILIIVACALLVVIILAQNPKGGGLSNMGAGASHFLGARQTADFLEKSTWYFSIGILAVVIFTYFLTTSPDGEGGTRFKTEGVDYSAPVTAPPAGGQAPQTPPAGGQPQPQPAQ